MSGKHLNGYSNEDVQYIFVEGQDLTMIPKNIENFFPNLLGIEWYNSNLMTVSADDLKPFPQLKVFSVYINHLLTVDGDLFEFTPNLRWISFYDNDIQHVGLDLLTQLSDLGYADFRSNDCINKLANSAQSLSDLNAQLISKCQPLETTSLPTTVTELPEACPASCVEHIESSDDEIRKLNDKIDEQSETISQLRQTNEEFLERFAEIEIQLKELSANPGSSWLAPSSRHWKILFIWKDGKNAINFIAWGISKIKVRENQSISELLQASKLIGHKYLISSMEAD